MIHLTSCSNCWYNPLQYNLLGSTSGYCVEQRVLLRTPDELACPSQMRKDLLLPAVLQANARVRQQCNGDSGLFRLPDGAPAQEHLDYEAAALGLNQDAIGQIVYNYGEYDTKIESIAQLNQLPDLRAELAFLSLARGYTHHCVQRGGPWTSGIHICQWIKNRFMQGRIPTISLSDIRLELPISAARQNELAIWLLLFQRLIYLSDLGLHARAAGHPVATLADLAEEAAAEVTTINPKKLVAWIKARALPKLELVFPLHEYRTLSAQLHRSRPW